MFNEVSGTALIENSVTIDGTTEIGMHIDGGSSTVGANASVTNSEGRSVVIENRQGGSVTVGEIDDTGEGILVQENDAGEITFSSLATLDTGAFDSVTLLNNNGATITFQELQATSSSGDTFVVNGGGNITVNDTQGDGSELSNTGDGSVLVVRGDDVPSGTDPNMFVVPDPNMIDASPTINIAGDLLNDGDGYVTDIQYMGSGGVTVSGAIQDPNGVGLGMLIQENSGGVFSFTGDTEILTGGADPAVTLRNNSGASIGFTQLQATSNDGHTFFVVGGGDITVSDPNNTGFIRSTGSGTSLFVLGANDPNSNAVGNPNVTINTDVENFGTGYVTEVQYLTAGSVDVNGDVSDPNSGGMGIRVWENSDANVSFNGFTTITNTTNTAVNLRNNSGTNVSFNNLRATSTDADTFLVVGGGNITVNNDPNNLGFITNTGTGSAVVVRGALDPNGVGNPVVTIDPNVNNSGGGYAVDVQDMTGGSVDVNGDITDDGADSMGIIAWNNADATLSFDGITTLNTGANTAVSLRNNSGSTISFQELAASAAAGDTFVVEGGGTIDVPADPNGTALIENTGTGSTLIVRGASDPNSVGNPDLTIVADVINGNGGNVVDVQDMTGGTVIVTGDVTDNDGSGMGVLLQDNSGGTFSFAGVTDLDTGANNALTMTDNEGSTTTFSNLKATAGDGDTVAITGGGTVEIGNDPNDPGFIENTGAGYGSLSTRQCQWRSQRNGRRGHY